MAKPEDAGSLRSAPEVRLTNHGPSPSRVGTYVVLGAMAGSIPVPWVPQAVSRRVRGALLHDIASRHNVALTPEARAALLESPRSDFRGLAEHVFRFAAGRMLRSLGPLSIVSPLRAAVGTFVLGHLFDRYLSTARSSRSIRIDVEEARVVRQAIERAIEVAFSTRGPSADVPVFPPPEDLRDPTTQLSDGLLMAAAGLPDWVVSRLERAFDGVVPSNEV